MHDEKDAVSSGCQRNSNIIHTMNTQLHILAKKANSTVGCAARILITGKAPAVWGGKHQGTVDTILAASTPRLLKQAEFINRLELNGI